MLLSSGKFAIYRTESDVFFRIAPAFGSLKSISNRKKLLKAWLQSDYFRQTGLNSGEVRDKVLSECRNAGDFLRIVMEAIAHKQGVRRWAEKTPDHVLYIPQIKKSIPNAKFIHMIRDGRDVAVSLKRMSWPRVCPWDSKHHLAVSGSLWKWYVSQGRLAGSRIGDDYLELGYEDLVCRPEETLRKVGHFIGEDLIYQEIQRNAVGTVSTPNSSFPYPASSRTVGRWRELPETDVTRLNTLLSPLLRELGYETRPSAATPSKIALWRLDKSYRYYWWLKRKIKGSPLSRFMVSRERFQPGALDRVAARFEAIRRSSIADKPSDTCKEVKSTSVALQRQAGKL